MCVCVCVCVVGGYTQCSVWRCDSLSGLQVVATNARVQSNTDHEDLVAGSEAQVRSNIYTGTEVNAKQNSSL